MPTQLTVQTGLVITPTANAADATGNFVVPADARQDIVLRFSNTTGAAITVTLDDVNTPTPDGAQAFNPDVQVVVPLTNGVRTLNIADTSRFINPANGRLSWTYSAGGLVVEVLGVT